MNIKKLLSLLVVGSVAMLAINGNVKAADNVTFTCDKTEIKINESATCEVKANIAAAPTSKAEIVVANSQYLSISNVKGNSAAGWGTPTASSTTTSTEGNGITTYSLAYTTTGSYPIGVDTQIMSFTITLLSTAKNLSSTENCAQICINAVAIDGASIASVGTGICRTPTVTIEDCTGTSCNAKTGAFLNYALLGGGAIIAVGAIIVARRNNKFYKI